MCLASLVYLKLAPEVCVFAFILFSSLGRSNDSGAVYGRAEGNAWREGSGKRTGACDGMSKANLSVRFRPCHGDH